MAGELEELKKTCLDALLSSCRQNNMNGAHKIWSSIGSLLDARNENRLMSSYRDEQREFVNCERYDSLIVLQTPEEVKNFLCSSVKIHSFGEDNYRNNPTIKEEVDKLTISFLDNGPINSFLNLCVVISDDDWKGFSNWILNKPTDTCGAINYADCTDIGWECTLLDGHHRRQALLNWVERRNEENTSDFPIILRVCWMNAPTMNWHGRQHGERLNQIARTQPNSYVKSNKNFWIQMKVVDKNVEAIVVKHIEQNWNKCKQINLKPHVERIRSNNNNEYLYLLPYDQSIKYVQYEVGSWIEDSTCWNSISEKRSNCPLVLKSGFAKLLCERRPELNMKLNKAGYEHTTGMIMFVAFLRASEKTLTELEQVYEKLYPCDKLWYPFKNSLANCAFNDKNFQHPGIIPEFSTSFQFVPTGVVAQTTLLQHLFIDGSNIKSRNEKIHEFQGSEDQLNVNRKVITREEVKNSCEKDFVEFLKILPNLPNPSIKDVAVLLQNRRLVLWCQALYKCLALALKSIKLMHCCMDQNLREKISYLSSEVEVQKMMPTIIDDITTLLVKCIEGKSNLKVDGIEAVQFSGNNLIGNVIVGSSAFHLDKWRHEMNTVRNLFEYMYGVYEEIQPSTDKMERWAFIEKRGEFYMANGKMLLDMMCLTPIALSSTCRDEESLHIELDPNTTTPIEVIPIPTELSSAPASPKQSTSNKTEDDIHEPDEEPPPPKRPSRKRKYKRLSKSAIEEKTTELDLRLQISVGAVLESELSQLIGSNQDMLNTVTKKIIYEVIETVKEIFIVENIQSSVEHQSVSDEDLQHDLQEQDSLQEQDLI